MYQKYQSLEMVLHSDELQSIRRFLDNGDLIETLCVCRAWRVTLGTSLFTEIKVTVHDDLMKMIRRYLQHRKTLVRTVLVGMNLDEWPFTSAEMILVACRGLPTPPPIVLKTFRYSHQYEQFVQRDRYDRWLQKMERLSIAHHTHPEEKIWNTYSSPNSDARRRVPRDETK